MDFKLVMATRAEHVEGFPAELREMLWRANFSYQPEYAVYAKGRGPGLVDYIATVNIPPRSVYGAAAHSYEASGTSEEMAIQAVAYRAMCSLRRELPTLSRMPFHYHPIHEGGLVNNVEYAYEDSPLFEQRISEVVRDLDRFNRCVTQELWETRRRLNRLQRNVEPYVRMGVVPRRVLYGEDPRISHDLVHLHFRFPHVHSERAPPVQPQNVRTSIGLQVPVISRTEATPASLLGPAQPLTHPMAPEDTGSPGHHLLDFFPEDFARSPYDME